MAEQASKVATTIPHQGPLIDVIIKNPRTQMAGIKVRGLIDTGADFVLFSASVAKKLALRQTGEDTVGGIGGGEVEAKIYSGSIAVPDLDFEKRLPLYAVNWDPTSHSVLLGRAFLRYFVFRYDGPSELFHFSKPLDGGQPHLNDHDG